MTAAPLKAGHTPTPWMATPSGPVMAGYSQPFAIGESGKTNLVAGCFGDVRGGEDVAKANAAFIVRACNSQDKLVEAVSAFLNRFDTGRRADTDYVAGLMRAALKGRGARG